MAKKIVVDLGGTSTEFGYSKVDRKKLYARRRRVLLDQNDKPCVRAELNADGTTLIMSGMTAQGYFAPDNRWVQNSELVGLSPDGKPLESRPSTLDVAQTLEAITPGEVLDVSAQTVYALDSEEIDPALDAAGDEGTIFRFNFNLRADYRMETGYLIKNSEGWFAVIGESATPAWIELDKPAVETFADDDDDDDLDFEMF